MQRIALITGATGGLGTSLVNKMADDGYKVIANHRNLDKAKAWLSTLGKNAENVVLAQADVAIFEEVAAMIAEIEANHGPVDILINNAGITRDTVFRKMSQQQWLDVISSNLHSVFNCTRHVINGMIDRGWGRVINISSVNGQRGQVGQVNYSAAKAGMHGFTKSLAVEVAIKNVTVNTVSPGYIMTDMVKAIPEEILKTKILPGIPAGRLGNPEEIAELISWLVSDKASYVNGANYSINGAQHVY